MKKNALIVLSTFLMLLSCKKEADLSSFDIQNDRIEESNENFANKNGAWLEIIYTNADKDDSLIAVKDTAARAFEISKILYDYLEELKTVIKEKNTTQYVDELFFNGLDITNEGNEFIQYIEVYKSDMISTVATSYPNISNTIKNSFDMGSIENRRGQQTNWMTLNYKGFPPISTIIKISIMQSDIKRIERKLYSSILGVKLKTKVDAAKQLAIDKEAVKKEEVAIVDDLEEEIDTTTRISIETSIPNEEILKKEEVVKETPKKEVVKKETPTKIIPKAIADRGYHIVAKNETVYRISIKYGLTPRELKKMNGMTHNNLVVGQKLRVKKK